MNSTCWTTNSWAANSWVDGSWRKEAPPTVETKATYHEIGDLIRLGVSALSTRTVHKVGFKS